MRLIAEDGSREWIQLTQYVARLAPEDWQEVIWPSQQGGQKWYAHVVNTWIRKLGPTLLMITCKDPNQPLKSIRYWGSTVLDMDAQAFVDILAIRWHIETFYEYQKDLLGSDHYQLMTVQGVLRFWTLTTCLMYFLEEQRTDANDLILTCGDTRRMLQYEHCMNLLEWFESCFKSGMTVEQVSYQLAL